MKTTLDRLESRIRAAGIDTRRDTLRTTKGPVPVLIAYHDYTGPFPTMEALDKLKTVARICRRYHVLRDVRGFYQATYITEGVLPQ